MNMKYLYGMLQNQTKCEQLFVTINNHLCQLNFTHTQEETLEMKFAKLAEFASYADKENLQNFSITNTVKVLGSSESFARIR